jgi:uncharacterized protein involved in response to NO
MHGPAAANDAHRAAGAFGAPLWSSAFRPFYLLGALHAPLVIAAGAGALSGAMRLPAPLWHGHEMLFGFAAAILIGTVLTALPSWAGTPEIRGARLAALAALWLAGRVAFLAAPWLPPWAVAAADALLLPVLIAMVAPQLLRVRNRVYLLLLPVLLALAIAGIAYHAFALAGDGAGASAALRAGAYGVILVFVLLGGILVPIFTGNALRTLGRGDAPRFSMPLEAAATLTVVLLAVLDLAGAPRAAVGAAALACALVHAVRTARWRGWRVSDQPLVAPLHLGFAWLVAAFALRAAADLFGVVPEGAWLHAFTVGALGMMMLGLMNRVVLRHTGRPLDVPRAMRLAYAAMFAAALVRLAATVHGLGVWAITLAAVLWAAPFVVFLALYGPALVRPSLPRTRPLQPG